MAPNGSHFPPFRSCLLVSDGEATLHFVRAMHGAGFAVLERPCGPASLQLAVRGEFDVVAWVPSSACDFDAPQLAAVAHAGVALIALLPEATPDAVSACLVAGADAVLAADADERVMVAHVNAVLRRRAPELVTPEATIIRVGEIVVDTLRCEVTRDGQFLSLTASEFRIIEFMARNAGRTLRPHEILNAVSDDYEYQPREAQDVFKVYARRIRKKIEVHEDDPQYFINVRGFGYRLEGGYGEAEPSLPAAVAYG